MNRVVRIALTCIATLGGAAASAQAATDVTITPPDGARLLEGQRFDIRVEGKGTGPFSATLAIDGDPVAFTSGAQNSNTSDGISTAGWGGYNLRGYAVECEKKRGHGWGRGRDDDRDCRDVAGIHTITATFTDAGGTTKVSSRFEIISVKGDRDKARNVIIMLGDGMGATHRTAARLVRHGVTAGDPDGWLEMDTFPASGMVTTHSLNSIVTDSAPGMACYSTGTHNFNGQEGVFPAHVTSPFFYPRMEYMSEYLHRTQGKSLGIVSTADLEDATPAANAVHTGNRGAGTGIIDQYFDESGNSGLRVLMGGGRRWFLPSDQFGSSRADASDYPALPADLIDGWDLSKNEGLLDAKRDVIADFKNAGFSYAATGADISGFAAGKNVPNKLLGLFSYGNMNVALDKIAKRRNVLLPGSRTFAVDDYHAADQPMLDEMTAAAINVLKQDRDGFVLMVEAAHIDKQAHAMDADRSVGEVIEFDRAIGVARDFAEDDRNNTVVIVLADHECSGFSIIGGLTGGINALKALGPDGAVIDPAKQPARQKVVGVYDAAGFPRYTIQKDGFPETFDIDGKILFGFGASGDRFETWLTKPRPIVDSLLPKAISDELKLAAYPVVPVDRDGTDGEFLRGQAVGRDQAVHTAADIPVSAFSNSHRIARQFVGVQRNTDVFIKLMRAAFGGY